MRVSYIGNTSVFQTDKAGSTPATRSTVKQDPAFAGPCFICWVERANCFARVGRRKAERCNFCKWQKLPRAKPMIELSEDSESWRRLPLPAPSYEYTSVSIIEYGALCFAIRASSLFKFVVDGYCTSRGNSFFFGVSFL